MVTQIGSQLGNVQALQLVQKRNGMGDARVQEMDIRPHSRIGIQYEERMEWGLVRFTVTLSSFSKVAVTTPAMVSKGRGAVLS